MAKAAKSTKLALTSCLYAAMVSTASAGASSAKLHFTNQCSFTIELYHSQKGSAAAKVADIAPGATHLEIAVGSANMWRHQASPEATLVEMTIDQKCWYNLGMIVAMPGWCTSYDNCKLGGKKGFNVPISIEPRSNTNLPHCTDLFCAADDKIKCADAYQFPKDDTKMRDCPLGTEFDITFCFGGNDPQATGPYGPVQNNPQQNDVEQNDQVQNEAEQNDQVQNEAEQNDQVQNEAEQNDQVQNEAEQNDQVQNEAEQNDQAVQNEAEQNEPTTPSATPSGEPSVAPAPAPGTLGKVRTTYTYQKKYAGNYAGTYNRVKELATCSKEPVTLHNPVGPMSERVGIAMRGPATISNIAVYSNEGKNKTWTRVSSYCQKSGEVDNMTFMNNKNVDYSGKGLHGPQGYATADGKEKADKPTVFAGKLDDASDPTRIGGGPAIATGVEVNIMTGQKCTDATCPGYHTDSDYAGWGGGQKMFVTKVQFWKGTSVDRPAIWMLPDQVFHSNQYGCNCRGIGPIGGCGELDIVEVIETNLKRNMLSTHYYHFDGKFPNPKGDNFAERRYDRFTVYVTLIDDSKDGVIKIVELDDFDFSLTELGSLYEQLLNC